MILIGFAPNPANPRKIRWWLCCYAWWPDEFLRNFSLLNLTYLKKECFGISCIDRLPRDSKFN
jgi:hypothetical protein